MTPTREAIDAETQELLAAATAPLAVPDVELVPRASLVHRFLREHEIEPGAAFSIEMAELYAMYIAHATKLGRTSAIVPPRKFVLAINGREFARKRPPRARRKGGRDRRVLMVRGADVALSLQQWVKENPLTPEQRAVFDHRQQKRIAECHSRP